MTVAGRTKAVALLHIHRRLLCTHLHRDSCAHASCSYYLHLLLYTCLFTKTFSNLGVSAHEFANEYNKVWGRQRPTLVQSSKLRQPYNEHVPTLHTQVYCDSDEDEEPAKEATKETTRPKSKRSRTRKAD